MIKSERTNIGKMAILVFWSSARTTGPNRITELPSNTRWRNYPANTISADFASGAAALLKLEIGMLLLPLPLT